MNTRSKRRGMIQHMDVVIPRMNMVSLHKPLTDVKTVYLNRLPLGRHKKHTFTPEFFRFVTDLLDKLDHSVNLVVAGSDDTFPNNTDKRFDHHDAPEFKTIGLHPRVNKVFVENLDEDLPNMLPLPLGLDCRQCPVTMDFFSKYINPSKPLLCTNFNRNRSGRGIWAERKKVLNLCRTGWSPLIDFIGNTSHEKFLEKMGKNTFTICVHGGGLDVNPKLWEALLIGVIPIIRENKPYTDIYLQQDLPVAIVKEWETNTINAGQLRRWHAQYYHYFTDPEKRERMLTQLSLAYWVDYVRRV